MTHRSLPAKLRGLRAREGLHVVQAAEKIGIGRGTLTALEAGRRQPTFPTLSKIARGYGVAVEDLLEEDNAPSSALEFGDKDFAKWLREATLMELHAVMSRPPEPASDKAAILFYAERKQAALDEFLRRAPISEAVFTPQRERGDGERAAG